MAERTCPHCGAETLPYRDGHWRHVRACEKNPNPICTKCKIHFVPHKIARHVARCGTKKETTAASVAVSFPAETESSPSSSEVSDGVVAEATETVSDVPADRLTPTDELVLPLRADPAAKPVPPKVSARKTTARHSARSESEDSEADDSDAADETGTGLVAAFAKREAPRTVGLERLAQSLRENWVLLALVGIGLALAVVWHRLGKTQELALKAPAQVDGPLPPPERPPYNPSLHGSLDQYLAKYPLPFGGA